MAKQQASEEKQGRIAQIRQTYRITKSVDPAIRWIIPVTFISTLVVFAIIGVVLGALVIAMVMGVPFALMVTLFLFGKRAERAAYASIAGTPGAAASALGTLRSGWFTTPFIEVTRQQDAVHRVIGRPGIILVAEAPANRAPDLLKTARAKVQRYASDVPIHEVICGDGGVPLIKLNRTLMKLPRALRPAEVTELRRKLDAVQKGPSLPIPRGPLPKGMRVPRAR